MDPSSAVAEHMREGSDVDAFPRLVLRPGADASEIRFGNLGYAEHALKSYAVFADLKRSGVIGPRVRFQVSLPTPLAVMAVFIAPANLFQVYPAYTAALLAELSEIVATIPHNELAIQWDICIEVALWEGVFPPPPGDWKATLISQLVHLGSSVPPAVELGYHLCYGDRGHKHFMEPRDTAILVDMAGRIAAGVERTIEFVHMPVPRDRDDDAYFAPLSGLALHHENVPWPCALDWWR